MAIEQPNSRQEISEGAYLAAVGYFGPLCLVGFLLQPKNKYTKYHAKQGLVLFAAEVVVGIGAFIVFGLTNLILIHIPILGGFLDFVINKMVFFLFLLVAVGGSFALSIVGAYNAWGGNLWQMPLLWYYARRLKF